MTFLAFVDKYFVGIVILVIAIAAGVAQAKRP